MVNFDLKHILDTVNNMEEIKPLPIVPNMEIQIELLTEMVNKQSEMIQQQNKMIEKQAELIKLIHQESIDSKKESSKALIISLIALAISALELTLPYIPTILEWFYSFF